MEYSFDQIKQAMKNKLSLLSEWRETLYFGVYERIIDVVAYIMNKLAYLAEYLYRETSWKDAQNRESLVTMSSLLSYVPARVVAPNGYVQIIADPTWENTTPYTYTGHTVLIPRWAEFTDKNATKTVFCTEDTYYYSLQVSHIDIPVKEGIPKTYVYTAKGEENEEIVIYSSKIDNNEIEVSIVNASNVVQKEVRICGTNGYAKRVFFINDTDNYYCELENALDYKSLIVRFGDGINAPKLTTGQRVMIKYAETKGEAGNIQSTGTISKIKSTLTDSYGDEVTLYVTNMDEISNGQDLEDIESIRKDGSHLFYAGYRCGGYNDWTVILDAHPSIHRSIIWTTDDLADDTLTTNQNKVFITAISADGSDLTVTQKDDIAINYLKDLKSPSELLSWQPLGVVYAIFRINAIVKTQTFNIISSQINEALDNVYSILNTDFNVNIYESNFTNIIDDNQYVIHHTTEIYNMEKDFIYNTQDHILLTSVTSTDNPDVNEQIYLVPDTLELWIKETDQDPVLVAYDDGGTFVENNNTYIDIIFSEDKSSSAPTGLANDATVYTASIEIGSEGAQPISIVGSNAQTINDLVNELNNDMTNIVATFNNGDNYIRLSVTNFGSSTLTFTDTDLVNTLMSGTASLSNPVNGLKYTLSNKSIVYATNTISFTVTDLASTPPDDFELSLIYKTKDGSGGYTNDIRLASFSQITSTDSDYNQYTMSYE